MTPCQRQQFNQKIKGTRQQGKQRGRPQNGGPGSSITNQPPHQQSRKMPSALAAVKAPMAPPNQRKAAIGVSRPGPSDWKRPGLIAADRLIAKENRQMGEGKRMENAEKKAKYWAKEGMRKEEERQWKRKEEQRRTKERRQKEEEERQLKRKRKEVEGEIMLAVKEKTAKEAALEEAKEKEGEKIELLRALDEKLGFQLRRESPARFSPVPRVRAPPPSIVGSNSSRSSTFSVDTDDHAPGRLPRRRETPPPASFRPLDLHQRQSCSSELAKDLLAQLPERYEESRMRLDDRFQQSSSLKSKGQKEVQKKIQ